ncbi:MAG: sugar phosphate isomerase/epimerase [Chloroflexi bacterium]|nr:sugar phosphate isomerase/epimerase [Chloroflexota bacterium]
MELKLACADFTFPLLTHDQAFKLVALLGFRGIDIGLFETRSHLQPGHVIPHLAASAKELAHKVGDVGLEIADIFFQAPSFESMAANHPDANERSKGRELFLRMLEFTLRCNAPHMTGLPGVAWQGETFETSLQRCVDELAWRAEQASKVGIVFSVEAHVGSLAPTPQKALLLVTSCPGLTLTLDYTHFASQGFPDDDVEPLVKHASHFHARGARRSRLQAPLKENVIDYPRVIRAMKQTGYSGYVGVEYVWQDWEHCNEVDNVSETVMMRDLIVKSFND